MKWFVSVTLFIISLTGGVISYASEGIDKVDVYLPILADENKALISDLEALLQQHDLANLSVKPIDHWHDYQHGLRAGRPGIYLAPPHFAAWSIHQHRFTPLLRVGTPLSYVIAARRDDVDVFEMNDLAGQTVCASKPLNLDYLTLINAFDNSLLSANIKLVPNVDKELHQNNTDCRGFALNNAAYERIAMEFPGRYIRLHQSARFKNLVFVAHPEIPAKTVSDLMRLVAQPAARDLLAPMYLTYSNEDSLLRASAADYPPDYYSQLLKYWKESSQ